MTVTTPPPCQTTPDTACLPTLTDFLRSRRARLRPADVGVSCAAARRRVPGLRREELAALAHISVSYYVRLEQGRVNHVSSDVLDSVATALMLDGRDRAILHDIVRSRRGTQRGPIAPASAGVPPLVGSFVSELEVPAWLESYSGDIVAWSRSFHAVFAWRHPFCGPQDSAARPNTIRMHFLDPAVRSLHVDWHRWAAVFVGQLWEEGLRRPDDPRLAALVAEMCSCSPEFARLWASGCVDRVVPDAFELQHPTMGAISMRRMVFRVDGDSDVTLSMAASTVTAQAPSDASSSSASSRAPAGPIAAPKT